MDPGPVILELQAFEPLGNSIDDIGAILIENCVA